MMNKYFTTFSKQLNLKKYNHISIEKIRSSNNTQSELFILNLVWPDEI